MEAELEVTLQKRRLRVREAYDELIMAQPEAVKCLAIQQECDTALQADADTLTTFIQQHQKVVEQFVEARLKAFDTPEGQSLPNEAILENKLLEYLQLLRAQLLQMAPYQILQKLLKSYGIPLYDMVIAAVEEAGKMAELFSYRLPYAQLKRKFPALPPYVICVVLAVARLRQLDEGYFKQEEKKKEAGMALGALVESVRANLKKAKNEVGSRGNPIIVPNEHAAKAVMDELEFVSGEQICCSKIENRYGLLLCWAMEYGKNAKRKSAICNHQVYFNIVPNSEAPKLQYYPPGFWRREWKG